MSTVTVAPLFADLGKSVSDLLSKEYPAKHTVSVNTTSSNGVNIVADVVKNDDNTITASLAPKYTIRDWGVQVSGSVDTRNNIKVEASQADKLLQGLKLNTTLLGGANQSVKAGFVYRTDWASFASNLYYPLQSRQPVFDSNIVFIPANRIAVGTEVEYGVGDNPELKRLSGVLAYSHGDFIATTSLKSTGDDLGVGATYYQEVNWFRGGAVGGEVFYDLRKPSNNIRVAVGTQMRLDSDVLFKAKADNTGRVGLAYHYALNKNSILGLGLEVDVKNIESNKAVKAAAKLTLQD